MSVQICEGIDVSPLKLKPNFYSDAKARSHVRNVFKNAKLVQPRNTSAQEMEQKREEQKRGEDFDVENANDGNREFLRDATAYGALPTAQCHSQIKAEHAFLGLKDLIAAILTMVFSTPQLHHHFYWFFGS
jgi:hypothetical protein